MSAATIDDVRRARRVVCFGASGSGKSTMATALGERLGLPVAQLDDLCWDPGWIEVPTQEQRRRALPIVGSDEWVIDALRSAIAQDAWPRIDVIVGLDYPRAVSLSRLLRRTWRRIRTRELVCNGNVETLGLALARDSIIGWHFRSWRSKRERMRRWHADPSAPPVLLLARPVDADRLLAALG
ncbi:MAG: adenylate kinase [Actinomycetota bacterium]